MPSPSSMVKQLSVRFQLWLPSLFHNPLLRMGSSYIFIRRLRKLCESLLYSPSQNLRLKLAENIKKATFGQRVLIYSWSLPPSEIKNKHIDIVENLPLFNARVNSTDLLKYFIQADFQRGRQKRFPPNTATDYFEGSKGWEISSEYLSIEKSCLNIWTSPNLGQASDQDLCHRCLAIH